MGKRHMIIRIVKAFTEHAGLLVGAVWYHCLKQKLAFHNWYKAHSEETVFLGIEWLLAFSRSFKTAAGTGVINAGLRDNDDPRRRARLMAQGFGGGVFTSEAEREDYVQRQIEECSLSHFLNEGLVFDVSAGDRVLEAGCGGGGNILCLKRRHEGITVDGFDLRPEAVEFANGLVGDDRTSIFQGDIMDQQFLEGLPDGRYDWILMLSVLTHMVGDSVAATREIRRRIVSTLFGKCNKGFFLYDLAVPDIPYLKTGWINNYIEDYTEYLRDLGGELYILPVKVEGVGSWGYVVRKKTAALGAEHSVTGQDRVA